MHDGWDDDIDIDADIDIDVDAIDGVEDGPPKTCATLNKFRDSERGGASIDMDHDKSGLISTSATGDGVVVDGWDNEDLDLDLDLDLDSCTEAASANASASASDSDDRYRDTLPQYQRRTELTAIEDGILRSLRDYVKSLPSVISSLRSVFDAEYNTRDHALHLLEYYQSRPQLRDYTVTTELPRMDYAVITSTNAVLIEKQDVADFLLSQPNTILSRSANQSLLADVITVLTGPDLVIRSQYLATAVASTCKFTLRQSQLHCDCTINLSLPGFSGQRVDIAHLDISIDFHPQNPSVHYLLKDVVTLVDFDDPAWLEGSAIFLASMASHDEYCPEFESFPSNADAFRDSLLLHLSKTQQMVQSSQTGLSSAWQQLDSVTSVSKKLDFVKRVGGGLIPSLPSADLVAAAADNLGQESYSEPQQLRRPGPGCIPDKAPDHHRPAPILGGFIMSGLTRLAKSVATSEAEEPWINALPSRVSGVPETKMLAPQLDGVPLTHHAVVKTVDPVLAASVAPNHADVEKIPCLSSRMEPDRGEEKEDDWKSETELDGWGDDDFSLDDDRQFEQSLPLAPDIPFLSKTSCQTSLHGPFHSRSQESPTMEALQTAVPPAPFQHMCHDDHGGEGRAMISPVPAFHHVADDDVIPTRKRWMNPRMLGP